MPTSLPQSVRKHLGDQVADDFSRWFEENVQHELVTKDQYREVLSRLDVLEERFDHVEERFDRMDERFDRMEEHVEERLDLMEKHFEERFEQVDQRFEQIDQRFEGMEERFDRRFEGMDEKLDRMNDRILSMTRWLIGLIALFGSLITVLLAIAQFGT